MTAMQDNEWDRVLDVKDLRVHYATPTGDVIACNGVYFQVFRGETLGRFCANRSFVCNAFDEYMMCRACDGVTASAAWWAAHR